MTDYRQKPINPNCMVLGPDGTTSLVMAMGVAELAARRGPPLRRGLQALAMDARHAGAWRCS